MKTFKNELVIDQIEIRTNDEETTLNHTITIPNVRVYTIYGDDELTIEFDVKGFDTTYDCSEDELSDRIAELLQCGDFELPIDYDDEPEVIGFRVTLNNAGSGEINSWTWNS